MNGAFIAHAVPVFNLAKKHIRDRLDPSMGMPREAFEVIRGVIGMKIIQEKKGVQKGNLVESERSLQMNTRSFNGRSAFEYFSDFSRFAHHRAPLKTPED